MFGTKKRFAAQTTTRLIRTTAENGSTTETAEDPFLGPQIAAEYAEVAKDFITHAAVVIGGTYIACRIAKALFK
jgi:hypothetical protein